MYQYKKFVFCVAAMAFVISSCQKATTALPTSGVADLTIVDAIPNSAPVIPIINTTEPIMWFVGAARLYYPGYNQYSPVAGNDTVYAVQYTDTSDVGSKSTGQMFYGILPLARGGIYSLFLCGTDTTDPDYLFTQDSLPYHSPADSTVGIRFVNLSTGSNPISINLEGSPFGSEVSDLPYKGITGFKNYLSNSSITYGSYLFVIRDLATGDSLTQFLLQGFNNSNGVGLSDPNTGNPSVFKNVTLAVIGQPGMNAAVPQTVMEIDNY
jgi:hypothetical protein